MSNTKQPLKKLVMEDSGQDLIEYALLAALIGLGAVTAMNSLADSIGNTLGSVADSLKIGTKSGH